MLTIKTREYPEGSLIGRFFDWTYRLSHGSADKEHDALTKHVIGLYAKAYLSSVNIEFPEPDLYDIRTVTKLSDKKPAPLDAARLKDYETTTHNKLRNAVAIRYPKGTYQHENLLVTNDNHYQPVMLSHQDGDLVPGWYIYAPVLTQWVNVDRIFNENRENIESGKKLNYWYSRIVVSEEAEREYKRVNRRLKMKNTVKHVFYKVFHTIDSVVLCLRFPFLYPRNRFTGLHYNNWKILDYAKALHQKNSAFMCIRVMDDPQKEFHYVTPHHPALNTAVEEIEKNHTVTTYSVTLPGKKEYVVCRDEQFKIFPRKMQFNVVWCHANQMHTYHPDFGWIDVPPYDREKMPADMFLHAEDKDYANYYYTYVKNRWVKYWEQLVMWFHNYVLAFVFCIPTSNELDALDDGWMKKFGIQICKDLRAALIKDKFLFKYRISQIKEKFGGLRWYDNGRTKEIEDIISKYEDISEHTCNTCGRPARYITSGYILPLCENCISEKGKLRASVLDDDGYYIGKIDNDGNFVPKNTKPDGDDTSEDEDSE